MSKKLIRLTESDLHRIVKESVNRMLNEVGDTEAYQKKLAALQARKVLKGDTDSAEDIYRYAKEKRKSGKAGNDFGYNQAYCDYLGAHQEDAVNEGIFDIFKKGPSKEELRQERMFRYYEKEITSLLKKASHSFEKHSGDPLYVKALTLAKEAYDEGIIAPHDFSFWYEKCYYNPRMNFLNNNNWLLRKGETWPIIVHLETLR